MSETQYYKLASRVGQTKNRVVALTHSLLVLQFVDQSDLLELANDLHEATEACYANGAVDIAILVSYSDLHALAHSGFFSSQCGRDAIQNPVVECCYVFSDDDASYYRVPHAATPYLEKYLRSLAS